MTPDEVRDALPVIRARCEEIGRDPATLAISVHIWQTQFSRSGQERVDRLAGLAELGVSRAMGLEFACARDDEALERVAADARAAGVELA
jgi:hypothetical protein